MRPFHVALVLGLFPFAVRAEPVDLRTFRAPWDPRAGLVLEPVTVPGRGEISLGAFSHYALRPVALRDASGSSVAYTPIRHQVMVDLVGSLGLGARTSVGMNVPMVLFQTGDTGLPAGVHPSGEAPTHALADPTLFAKSTLVANEKNDVRSGFGLAATAHVALPAGDRAAFVSSGEPQVGLRVLAEYSLLVLQFQASLGYALRTSSTRWPDRTLSGIPFGDEIPWAMGATLRPSIFFPALDRASRQSWEVALRGSLPAGPVAPFGLGEEGAGSLSPLLVSVADKIALGEERDTSLTTGLDVGLLRAAGVPVVRGMLGLSYAPRAHDKDGDGIPDSRDACPELAEDKDGLQDSDGCPEDDADDDEVSDHEDACPSVKGEATDDPKTQGCPRGGGH